MPTQERSGGTGGPDVSLIMPCYNEEDNLGYIIPRLIKAFRRAEYRIQVVAVDNGSRDRTGEIIAALRRDYPEIAAVRVETNIGFGHGIISGIPHCTAPYVGMVAADGQVDAEDVVRLYEAVVAAKRPLLGKVRRRFRMDGQLRRIQSIAYNLFVWCLYPRLGSLDVNGNPRLMPRDVLLAMRLESTDWMLDPEMLIKAHLLDIPILEVNVFSRMRGGGLSHVRLGAAWQFFKNLLLFRFTGRFDRWRQEYAGRPLGTGPQASRPQP